MYSLYGLELEEFRRTEPTSPFLCLSRDNANWTNWSFLFPELAHRLDL